MRIIKSLDLLESQFPRVRGIERERESESKGLGESTFPEENRRVCIEREVSSVGHKSRKHFLFERLTAIRPGL